MNNLAKIEHCKHGNLKVMDCYLSSIRPTITLAVNLSRIITITVKLLLLSTTITNCIDFIFIYV